MYIYMYNTYVKIYIFVILPRGKIWMSFTSKFPSQFIPHDSSSLFISLWGLNSHNDLHFFLNIYILLAFFFFLTYGFCKSDIIRYCVLLFWGLLRWCRTYKNLINCICHFARVICLTFAKMMEKGKRFHIIICLYM